MLSSPDRLEQVMQLLNISMFEWDLRSQKIVWQNRLPDMFDLDGALPPSLEMILSKIIPEDRARWRDGFEQAVQGKTSLNLEFTVQLLDGHGAHLRGIGCWVEPQIHPKSPLYRVVFYDESDKKNALLELAHSQSRHQDSVRLATLGEMAIGIAHEINNPLCVISARAALLRRQIQEMPTLPTDTARLLESMEKQAKRISKIIRGLRAFSKNGDHDPLENHLLTDLVEDALELCRGRLTKESVQLQLRNLCPSNTQIVCRGDQWIQIIVNLINNAIDATQGLSGREVTLEIFVDNTGTHCLVSDSGPGVPSELEEKIMLPFFTTKGPNRGTGLGLSLCASMIKSHGGTLFLDRTRSASCFHVKIPHLTPGRFVPNDPSS